MAVDGSITIGAIFTTDKFDRQIAKFESDMKKEEEKLELKLNAKIQAENELKKHKQDIFDLEQEYEKLAPKVERYNELISQSKAGNNLSPKDFQFISQIENSDILQQYDKMGNQLDRMYAKEERLNAKVQQKAYAYKQVADKVDEYKRKIENIQIQKQVADVEKLKSGFNSVGSSIQGAVKHVARLALGIFGIRSAFMFLRRASSDLASYAQQYATNLEYIRYALTQMIAPVLQWIVRLAATLLGYINAIMQGWFGINLFARGSAENFNKMKAGASGVSKAVKEIKKQLTGFDEINMLTDQSDTGTSAGAGGVGMPDFDLSKMQGEPPEWLKWIIDNRDLILAILAGIAAGIIAIKLGLGGLTSLGIGLMVAGIVLAIQALVAYLKDPNWQNFGKLIQGIGVALIGLGLIMQNVYVVIAGVIVLIVGIIVKYWNQIKAFLQSGIDWLSGKSDWVHQMFGDTIGNIYDDVVKYLQIVLNWIDGTFKNIKGAFDGFIKFIKGVFTGNWEQAWEGIKQIFSNTFQAILRTFGTFFTLIKNNVVTFARTVGDIIASAFKIVVNSVLSAIERVLNSPIRAINRLIGVINAVPGINLSTLPTFNLPRLKVGGIVNMPNKGTLVGGAITGESGREGVIPLTDQQAMAQLGAEIGRNVVVNLTNITKVGNRQIAREIKQINAEQEFAYNV